MSQTPLQALNDAGAFGWRQFFATDKPVCPHCGTEHDISESGTYRLYEEGEHNISCENCDLDFVVKTSVVCSFSTDDQPEQQETRHATE